MKIYEITFTDATDPDYVKSKKELKEALSKYDKSVIRHVNEHEFEYNLDSICKLCNNVWR